MYKFLLISVMLFSVNISQVAADHWGKPKLNGPGPWDQNISVFKIKGTEFKIKNNGKPLVMQAGVSSLIEYKNKLRAYFQWLPTKKSLQSSFDHIAFVELNAGIWSEPMVIKIPYKRREQYPFDPTVVNLEDGSIRMFFTSLSKTGTYIGSARSTDGIDFLIERGTRLEDEKYDLRDCAVIYFKEKWHMIIPNHRGNGKGLYATSTNGLDFVKQTDISIKIRGDWLGNMTLVNNKVYFFGTGFIASTSHFKEWNLVSRHMLQDPAVLMSGDDAYILSTTR
jgi:hypothetical protein